MQERIGIDIGNVIIGGDTDKTNSLMFTDRFLETQFISGALETIQGLVRYYGQDNVFLVSKCGEAMQAKTREFLNHHDFYARTGVNPNNLQFCLCRDGKAPICEKLEITVFIDDRLEVLSYMGSHVKKLVLFRPRPKEMGRNQHVIRRFGNRLKIFNSWEEIADLLLPPAG